jgi:hypothetical protein
VLNEGVETEGVVIPGTVIGGSGGTETGGGPGTVTDGTVSEGTVTDGSVSDGSVNGGIDTAGPGDAAFAGNPTIGIDAPRAAATPRAHTRLRMTGLRWTVLLACFKAHYP